MFKQLSFKGFLSNHGWMRYGLVGWVGVGFGVVWLGRVRHSVVRFGAGYRKGMKEGSFGKLPSI